MMKRLLKDRKIIAKWRLMKSQWRSRKRAKSTSNNLKRNHLRKSKYQRLNEAEVVVNYQLPSRLQRSLRNRIQVRQQAERPKLLKRATTPQAYNQRQREAVADLRKLSSKQTMTARWPVIMTTKIITTLTRRTTLSPQTVIQFRLSAVPVARLTPRISKTLSQTMTNKTMCSHGMNIASNAKMVEMWCAARTAPRWLTTSALASKLHPKETGGARIASPKNWVLPLRRRRSSLDSRNSNSSSQSQEAMSGWIIIPGPPEHLALLDRLHWLLWCPPLAQLVETESDFLKKTRYLFERAYIMSIKKYILTPKFFWTD